MPTGWPTGGVRYHRPVTVDLAGSPYSLEESGRWILDKVAQLHERVDLLREQGRLTEETLRAYFGDKRFEQIAESNAIEGSTLNVGETQMAVLRGVTITGHNPAYSKDAVNLAKALDRMVEIAQDNASTGLRQVKELHALIVHGDPKAGVFRSVPVRISGSPHVPPELGYQVMDAMEHWDRWSSENAETPALMRAIVLHAWLTHIHPFTDGNGRTARAVMNLELIRAGLPSVIIRRKDRLRYYEALAESDQGGDLGLIAELILTRATDALRDLERAAKAHQGYDLVQAQLRKAQERRTAIWNDAVRLLFSLVDDALDEAFGRVGDASTRWYDDELSADDYAALSSGDSAGNSWLFRIDANLPGVGSCRRLAWTGYRSHEMQAWKGVGAGPSIFWSVPDSSGYRKWVRDDSQSPGVAELTLELPNVDRWIVRGPGGRIEPLPPSEVAGRIARAVAVAVSGP